MDTNNLLSLYLATLDKSPKVQSDFIQSLSTEEYIQLCKAKKDNLNPNNISCNYSKVSDNERNIMIDGQKATPNKLINKYGIIEHKLDTTNHIRNKIVYTPSYEDTSDYTTIKNVNHYTNKRDFVAGEYINIAKSVIKSLRFMKKVVDGKKTLVATDCYQTVTDIINKWYHDPLFEDISQEMAKYLLENIDSWDMIIVNYENGKMIYKFSEFETYKTLCNLARTYIYNQKIKRDNVECSDMYVFCGYEEDEETHEQKKSYTSVTQSVKTKEYRDYVFTESKRCITEEEQIHIAIIKDCIIEQLRKRGEKPFIIDKCFIVLNLMRCGFDNKKISKKSGISINSVTKYKRLIKKAFSDYKEFEKARLVKEEEKKPKAAKPTYKPIKSKRYYCNPLDYAIITGTHERQEKPIYHRYNDWHIAYNADYEKRLVYFLETQR